MNRPEAWIGHDEKADRGRSDVLTSNVPVRTNQEICPTAGQLVSGLPPPETPEKGVVMNAGIYSGNAYRMHDGNLSYVPPESKSFGK